MFAGPTDDPFFVDLGATFDDVTFRSSVAGFGSRGGGSDYVAGYNVHTIAIQVPISQLVVATNTDAMTDRSNVIGVYATASRPRVTIRRNCTRTSLLGRAAAGLHARCHRGLQGQWVQVSRLGIPLVNEVLIPLAEKDFWNRAPATDDVANFGAYLLVPSLPTYAQVLYGTDGAPRAPRATWPRRAARRTSTATTWRSS